MIMLKKSITLKSADSGSKRIEYSGPRTVIQTQLIASGEINGFTIAYISSGQRLAIWLAGSDITSSNNVITGGFFSGISITHGSAQIVRGNQIEGNRRTGIQISEAVGTIGENVIRDNGQHGIHITENSPAILINNHILQNKLNGIYVDLASTIAVRNNQIESNAGDGVVIDNQSAGEISANLIAGNNHHGVLIRKNSQPEIDHNAIARNRLSGVLIYGTVILVLQNNIVIYNQAGIVAGIGKEHTNRLPRLHTNNVWKNATRNYHRISPVPTGLSVDPCFVNTPIDDYHLQTDSPIIGAASDGSDLGAFSSYPPQTELENTKRQANSTISN